MQPFDWPAWADAHRGDLRSDEFIQNAGLETIVKLITIYIRSDRFNDGHLLSVLRDGTVLKILKRLEDFL